MASRTPGEGGLSRLQATLEECLEALSILFNKTGGEAAAVPLASGTGGDWADERS